MHTSVAIMDTDAEVYEADIRYTFDFFLCQSYFKKKHWNSKEASLSSCWGNKMDFSSNKR